MGPPGEAADLGYDIRHKLWAERPIFLGELPRSVVLFAIALGVYVLGLVGAAAVGTSALYLTSPAFLIGALGVGWCWTSMLREVRRVDAAYNKASAVFESRSAFVQRVESGFRRTCDPRRHALVVALLFVVSVVAAFVAFYGQTYLGLSLDAVEVLRPWVFDAELYTAEHRLGGFAVVVLVGLLCSLVVGLAVWLAFSEILVLRGLKELAVRPVPEAVRALVRPLADFHVRVARDWSLGVVLFVVVLGFEPRPVYLIIYAILVLVGILIFLVPQAYVSDLVQRSYERAAEIAIRGHQDMAHPDLSQMAILVQASGAPKTWVYSSDEFWGWFLAQGLAITALILQIVPTIQ